MWGEMKAAFEIIKDYSLGWNVFKWMGDKAKGSAKDNIINGQVFQNEPEKGFCERFKEGLSMDGFANKVDWAALGAGIAQTACRIGGWAAGVAGFGMAATALGYIGAACFAWDVFCSADKYFGWGIANPIKEAFSNISFAGVMQAFARGYADIDSDPMIFAGDGAEIGGVGGEVGIIKEFDTQPEEAIYNDYIFCFENKSAANPFSDEELQIIIRELANAIYNYGALPIFSLDFNERSFMYPVMHPIFQNTLVGEVIGLLDYFMKGFCNGDTYTKKFIYEDWPKLSDEQKKDDSILRSNLLNIKKMFINEDGQQYFSLREKIAMLSLNNIQNTKNFSTSFRIIAKQKDIQKRDNVFFINPDFDVFYTIYETPDFKAKLQKDDNQVELPYEAYDRLCKEFCEEIKTKMCKVDLFRKYFQMLGIINFFCYLLNTLKSKGRMLKLDPIVKKSPIMNFPKEMPFIPVRYYEKKKVEINYQKILEKIPRADLEKFFSNMHTGKIPDLKKAIENHLKDLLNTKAYNAIKNEGPAKEIKTNVESVEKNMYTNILPDIAKEYKKLINKIYELLLENHSVFLEKIFVYQIISKKQNNVYGLDSGEINKFKEFIDLHNEQIGAAKAENEEKINELQNKISILIHGYPEVKKYCGSKAFIKNLDPENAKAELSKVIQECRKLYSDLKLLAPEMVNEHNEKRLTEIEKSLKMTIVEFATHGIKYNGNLTLPIPVQEFGTSEFYKKYGELVVGGTGLDFKNKEISDIEFGNDFLKQIISVIDDRREHMRIFTYQNKQYAVFRLKLNMANCWQISDSLDYAKKSLASNNTFTHNENEALKTLSRSIGSENIPNLPSYNPKNQTNRGETVLHYAASYFTKEFLSKVQINKELLKIPDINGWLPIHCAAYYGNTDAIEIFLKIAPETAKSLNNAGGTPLMQAVLGERIEAVKILIPYSNVNQRMPSGICALYMAILTWNEEIALKLLDTEGIKESINFQSHSHKICLFTAIEGWMKRVALKIIEKGFDLTIKRGSDSYTALHLAAELGQLDICKAIVSKNKSLLNETTSLGYTPLHLAAYKGHYYTVDYFVKMGADNTKLSENKETPIMRAMYGGNKATAILLAKNSTNENLPSIAAKTNNYEVLDILLKKDPSLLTKETKEEKSVIFYLLRNGQYQRIKEFELEESKKLEYLNYALQGKQNLIIDYLLSKFKYTPSELNEFFDKFIKADNINIVKDLFNSELKAKIKYYLYFSAINGSKRCLKYFLENYGENKGYEKCSGNKHLLYAGILSRKKGILKLIFSHLKDVNIPIDEENNNAAHIAARFGCLNLISFLHGSGINFNANNKNGLTPLQEAMENDDPKILKLILKLCYIKKWPQNLLSEAIMKEKKNCGKMLKMPKYNQHGDMDILIKALFANIRQGKVKEINKLIDQSVDVNMPKNNFGEPEYALHSAIINQKSQIVRILIEAGANPMLRDISTGKKCTAYETAVIVNAYEIIKYLNGKLSQEEREISPEIKERIEKSGNKYIKGAIQGDFSRLENDEKEIVKAIKENNIGLFKELIKNFPVNFVLVESKEMEGNIPLLFYAFYYKSDEIIETFIKSCSVDFKVKDSKNRNILENLLINLVKYYPGIDENFLGSFKFDQYPSILDHTLKILSNIEKEKPDKSNLIYEMLRKEFVDGCSIIEVVCTTEFKKFSKILEILIKYKPHFIRDFRDANEDSLAHMVCSYNKLDNLEYLIKAYPDIINQINKDMQTPIMIAALRKQNKLVKFLVLHGADINKVDRNGSAAIHYAIIGKNLQCVMELVPHINDWTLQDRDGFTPFLLAAANDLPEIMHIISGPQIKSEHTHKGRNALHLACAEGKIDIVRILIQEYNFDPNERAKVPPEKQWKYHSITPLELAAAHGHMKIFNQLLYLGANINNTENGKTRNAPWFGIISNNNGIMSVLKRTVILSTPSFMPNFLLAAARRDNVEFIKIYCQCQLNLNVTQSYDGKSALHIACENNASKAVCALISLNCDLIGKDHYGNTPLHYAAEQGSVPIIHMLCQRGIKVDELNEKKQTPLYLAAKKGKYGAVFTLISYGSTIKSATTKNITSAQAAAKRGFMKIVKLLIIFGDRSLTQDKFKKLPDTFRNKFKQSTINQLESMRNDWQKLDNSQSSKSRLAILWGMKDAILLLTKKDNKELTYQDIHKIKGSDDLKKKDTSILYIIDGTNLVKKEKEKNYPINEFEFDKEVLDKMGKSYVKNNQTNEKIFRRIAEINLPEKTDEITYIFGTYLILNDKLWIPLKEQIIKYSENEEVWAWFTKFFENVFYTYVSIEETLNLIKLFENFYNNLAYHGVQKLLPQNLNQTLTHQFSGKKYLEDCIFALSKTKDPKLQAKLLDQLPYRSKLEEIFNKEYPVAYEALISRKDGSVNIFTKNDILNSALSEDEFLYRTKCYLTKNYLEKHIDLEKCIQFFECANKIQPKHLTSEEKILIYRAFFYCVTVNPNLSNSELLLEESIKFKRIAGNRCFYQLFTKKFPENLTLDAYTSICQFIIELISEKKPEITRECFESLEKIADIIHLQKTLRKQKTAIYTGKFQSELTIDQAVDAFKVKENSIVKFPLKNDELEKMKRELELIEKYRAEMQPKSVMELEMEARNIGILLIKKPNNEDLVCRLLAILRESIRQHFNVYPYCTQILAILSLLLIPAKMKGRVAQIKTGEGKSTIIAMLAAFLACQGRMVDIITSSEYLAIRDEQKYHNFYKDIGLTSSHICYRQNTKEQFNGMILYGTNHNFEFSLLREGLKWEDVRYTKAVNGEVIKRKCDTVIVDELDNLFLDCAMNSARLAMNSKEDVSWVYEPIYKFVTGKILKEDSAKFEEIKPELVKECKKIIDAEMNNRYPNAKKFDEDRIKMWINSAYHAAYELKLNRDYIIHKTDAARGKSGKSGKIYEQIVIVDYANTGRLNYGSRWSNGIHEFCEVKHGITPENESLTTASVCHASFFKEYVNIFGVTGTVGEETERREIAEIYHTDTYDVPTYREVKRVKHPSSIYQNTEEQEKAIIAEIRTIKPRPILILMKTIEQSSKFCKLLTNNNIKFQLLNEQQETHEEVIITKAGELDSVTVATNTAGRGTDIILSDDSIKKGGLHVIFAFYPTNIRVEEQGFGRAGRQGKPGSGKFILTIEDEEICRLVPNPADLLKDKEFETTLRMSRTKKNEKLSERRKEVGRIEIKLFEALSEFFDVLKDMIKYLKLVNRDSLIRLCKSTKINIENSKKFYQNTLLKDLKNCFDTVCRIRGNKQEPNWSSYVDYLYKMYLEYMKQKWGKFFTKIDHNRDAWSDEKRQSYLQKWKENLKKYQENNYQGGFFKFVMAFLGQKTDMASKGSIDIEKIDSL